MGISWEEFWNMNPRILKAIQMGYDEEIKRKDYLNWLSGQYTISAILVSLDTFMNGEKAKSEYMEKPILVQVEKEASMTEEERIELAMQKEILAMEAWIENDKRRGLPVQKIL